MEGISVNQTFESEIINTYRLFVKYCYQDRDLVSLQSLFSPQITLIGLADDEIAYNYESVTGSFERDFKQYPESVDYSEKHISVKLTGPGTAVLIAHFDTQEYINTSPFSGVNQRLSALLKRINQQWLIVHMHFSSSKSGLKTDNSSPSPEIQEKNLTLEKLVNKRTRELCKLNIELSEANKEINELKLRFETLFERASDGIIIADWKNHQFFMINQKMCNILGYSPQQLQRFWLEDLIPEEDLTLAMDKILQETNSDITFADNIPMKCANQQIKYFDVTSQHIQIKKNKYLLSIYCDVTEHKKNNQLREQTELADDENEYMAEVPLNLNVLLVDDKKVNLQVISIMLQGANCIIETANNGLEALEKFKPEKHDVVLMDIMMPLMDGLTAMKEIRKIHQNLRPIIAITANAMNGDKEKYLAEGFDAYITKPLTMKKLTSELLQLGLMKQN